MRECTPEFQLSEKIMRRGVALGSAPFDLFSASGISREANVTGLTYYRIRYLIKTIGTVPRSRLISIRATRHDAAVAISSRLERELSPSPFRSR